MQETETQVGPIVALEGVSKTYHAGTQALAGIDLAIPRGGFVSILGPSGCGKSTLLRIIAGLLPPSTGQVRWSESSLAKRIGFVFQEPTLMPWASVRDNVYLPLRLAGQSRAAVASRISSTLRSLGLSEFENAYPRQLSGGMRMRVSIARALITDPPLLLLDEPFAALDEFTRFRLDEELLSLWQEQHWTVVFVTHSIFESVFLSNRIIVMTPRPGRIAADVAIDLPYPRRARLRTSRDYIKHCREISDVLSGVTT